MKLIALFSLLALSGLAFSIPLGSCSEITSPGIYVLNQSLYGSPIPAPEIYAGDTACIKVASSDVTIDCNGFSMTGLGYGHYGANAILANGTPDAPLSNISVINCPSINDYQGSIAIAFSFTDGGRIANNSFAADEEGVMLYASSNIVIANNTAYNDTNGFYAMEIDLTPVYPDIFRTSSITFINNSAINSSSSGFYLDMDDGMLTLNTAYGSGRGGFLGNGIYISGTGNRLINNLVQDNGVSDFSTAYINSSYCDNEITNLTGSGGRPVLYANSKVEWSDLVGSEVVLCGAGGSVLDNVTAHGSDSVPNNGFFILLSPGVLIANSSSSGNYLGFWIAGGSNGGTFMNDVAQNDQQNGFFEDSFSHYNTFISNTVHDDSHSGFWLQGNYNNATNNTAYGNNVGFFLTYTEGNMLVGNAAHDNSAGGFYFQLEAANNFAINNTAYNNGVEGFYVSYDSNTLEGNTAYGNAYGFRLPSFRSHDTTLTNNTAHDNSIDGFYINSVSNLLEGNTAYNNENGFYMDSGSGSSSASCELDSNTAYSNGNYGLYITLPNSAYISLAGNTLYSNGYDFYTESKGKSISFSYSMDSTRFLAPSGAPETSSNISIEDSLDGGDAYSITGVSSPDVPPEGHVSFSDKFVDISAQGGSPSIDWISWSWSDSELFGYNKSNFELWQYDSKGGWALLNNTPDVMGNTLSFLDLQPASDYGILLNGTYFYPIGLTGANVTNSTDLARWNGTSAGNLTSEGGNITFANMNGTTLTDRWAAFFGDVSGSIFLGDGSNYVYSWNWTPANGGQVCASLNPSFSQIFATGATGSDIDGVWGFTGAGDSGANTFNGTNCTLSFGAVTLGDADYAVTGTSGDFRTCAFKINEPPLQKENMFFCGNILASGTQWNNGAGNYEIIVPTEYGPSGVELYYFYLSLD